MNRFLYIAITAIYLIGCTQENGEVSGDPGAESDSGTVTPLQTGDLEMSGAEAYEMACASCHESGLDDAPATGDPDAWSDRSMLWEAVLFEHVNKGYMGMPGKGGDSQLSDRAVVAATEHMLSIVYPDMPPDQ